MSSVDREEFEFLRRVVNTLVSCGGNKQAAAEEMGMPRSTYRDQLQKAEALGILPTIVSPDVEAKVAEVEYKYSAEIKDLKRKLKLVTEDAVSATAIRESIYGLFEHEANPPDWVVNEEVSDNSPGTPTLLLSDWHWGEVVNPEEIDGINEYNLDVARSRFRRTIEKTIDLCFNHMVNPEYKGIVLALGGDMLGGDIHQELAETNDGRPIELVFDLFDTLVWAIDTLLEHFEHVFIPCAFGNHGRNGAWRNKQAAVTNFDWQLYCWLERHYKHKTDRVQFSVPMSFDTRYRLHGYDFLLTHGDRLGVRGGDGVIGVVGPIMRGANKLANTYAAQGKPIHYIMMGHWHQKLHIKNVLVNGSGKGYDEFAMSNRFEPEPPIQMLFWTNPKYGITYEVPLFLDNTNKPSEKWIEILK